MKYILIGTPNVGKSTLGKRVAEELGLPFYDTDVLADEEIGPTHPYERLRFSYRDKFYDTQVDVLRKLAEKDESAIIATGALLPLHRGCPALLPTIGTVIHIRRSEQLASQDARETGKLFMVRIGDDGEPVERSEINMRERAVEVFAADLPVLDVIADFIVENDGDIDSGAEKLRGLIEKDILIS